MDVKKIISMFLLIFVCFSIGFFIWKETKLHQQRQAMKASPSPAVSITPASVSTTGTAPAEKIVVYYFHGNTRCVSCNKIEKYTKETVEKEFADRFKDGRMEWHPVNVEAPENAHYIDEYQLTSKTVYLSRIKDGKEINRKNLDRVWELVNDKTKFVDYVKTQATSFVEGKNG